MIVIFNNIRTWLLYIMKRHIILQEATIFATMKERFDCEITIKIYLINIVNIFILTGIINMACL